MLASPRGRKLGTVLAAAIALLSSRAWSQQPPAEDAAVDAAAVDAAAVDAAPAEEAPAEEAPADAAEVMGKLEVRIKGELGDIYIDGTKVGEGRFAGELEVGEHDLEVFREGYEPVARVVSVREKEVVLETVALSKLAEGDALTESEEGDWTFDGLYGGVQLHGMFLPAGSGHTLDGSCDTIGATSCDAGLPAGGGIAGYVGYAFAPLGFELLLLAGADVTQPAANFDGQNGSQINPLVAQPARDEEFLIARFGGGGVLRLRALIPIDRFRVSGALGAGIAYRSMVLARDTLAADGGTSETSDDGLGYVTPVLSFELSGQVRLSGTTSLALGFNLWLEHAGSDLETEPINDAVLTGGSSGARALATPAYLMASGTQVFMGPFLGLQFGP